MHRPGNTTVAIALLVAGSLAVSACGRDTADLVQGKTLFVSHCGSCHQLARAGTKGTQGPSLDAAFRDDRQVGMNNKTIRGVVHHQIGFPRRGSIMPANLVRGQQANDVAAYVGYAAGRPGKDTGPLAAAGQPKTSGKPIVAKAGKLTIDAIDGTAFSARAAIAKPGQVTFTMPNKSPVNHNIAIKGGGATGAGKIVPQGSTSTFTVNLKPGKYTFFCQVPGHEQAGMKGTLTVK
ncbi:MAG: plastocyanin/azurin family copper-binding protein [Thermoleophilaceae bacterium]